MAPTRKYPYQDGDTTVLGPEIFASSDGHVISWKGENYVPQGPAHRNSNLVAHARRELRIIGEDTDTVNGLCNVVQAFADMGHSGSSAHFASLYLDKLLRYQPLSELTDDPGEWLDRHAEGMTPTPLWQSARNPEAFSRDGGKTYTLLSEQEAAGDLATTPLHHSKALPQADQPTQDGA